MEKYCYSTDGEIFNGHYDSVEEAIEWAKNDLDFEVAHYWLNPGDYEIFTARCVFYEPQFTTFDVECLTERISDNVYGICNIDDYMCDLTKEQLKDLTEKINQTLKTWVKDNYKRSIWYADNIQKHVVHIE